MKKPALKIYEDILGSEEDIYSSDNLEEMYEDDSISAEEYGFMVGYLKECELEG